MGNASKIIEKFLDSLSEDEARQLVRALRLKTVRGPLTPREFNRLHDDHEARVYSAEELARYEAHARTLAGRDIARAKLSDARVALATAQRKRGPEGADGYPIRSAAHDAEVARCQDALQDAETEMAVADAAEVAARPHQPKRRRTTPATSTYQWWGS